HRSVARRSGAQSAGDVGRGPQRGSGDVRAAQELTAGKIILLGLFTRGGPSSSLNLNRNLTLNPPEIKIKKRMAFLGRDFADVNVLEPELIAVILQFDLAARVNRLRRLPISLH